MKKTFRAFLTVLALFSLIGIAHADSIVLCASDFTSGQPNHDGSDFYTGWEIDNHAGSTYWQYFAPVHLPQDAQVTSVVLFYEDNSAGSVRIRMQRRNLYTDAIQNMIDGTTSGAVSGTRNTKYQPVSYGKINNGGYAYWVYLYFNDTDVAVKAVKIIYTVP